MNFFLPNNLSRILTISVLCVVYAFMQALAFRSLVTFPFPQLMLDGMMNALFFTGVSFLLWKVVKYGNFETLEIYQRFINYTALGFLAITIWTGLGYISAFLVFNPKNLMEAIKMFPLKAFVAFLIYLLLVQFFRVRLAEREASPQPVDEDTEEDLLKPDDIGTEEIQPLERIVVRSGQKINMIQVSEIVYFRAEGGYVRIFTDSVKFLKEETMKYFQLHLPEKQFVRVHRSYLVNTVKILRIELYEKQNQLLTLSNGDKIKISASGYKRLREKLGL